MFLTAHFSPEDGGIMYVRNVRHASIKVQERVTQHTFPNLLCPFLGGEFSEEFVHQTGDTWQPCGVSADRSRSLNDLGLPFHACENELYSEIRFQDR